MEALSVFLVFVMIFLIIICWLLDHPQNNYKGLDRKRWSSQKKDSCQ